MICSSDYNTPLMYYDDLVKNVTHFFSSIRTDCESLNGERNEPPADYSLAAFRIALIAVRPYSNFLPPTLWFSLPAPFHTLAKMLSYPVGADSQEIRRDA